MSQPNKPNVAYFSMEYAIADDLPIYAGGLGILAADTVLEAGTQNRAFSAVGLVYHQAFTGDDPDQRTIVERLMSNQFELAKSEAGERLVVRVQVADRIVALQAWVKTWGETRLILLDARTNENNEQDQQISDHLYPSDPTIQLSQEICIGFGGVAMLEAMNIRPDVHHLNEGHSAFAGLAVVLKYLKDHPNLSFQDAVAEMKPHLVGTKHTILAGAGVVSAWQTVADLIGPTLASHGTSLADLEAIASKANGDYSGTKLMLELANIASGVSRIHVASEHRAHEYSELVTITNGIHAPRWTTADWKESSSTFSDEKLWTAHKDNRQQLLDHVREQSGVTMDPERLTVVWARRMAEYKRPGLLVSDLTKLSELIHDATRPIQFIVAGRANPADAVGIALMNSVIEAARRPDLSASFAYLPHYNPISAKFLVRGADLWLNTPVRGFEACGTSGMKASLNGALQFTTSDGWADEIDINPIGWRLPAVKDPSNDLYEILATEIAPLYYDNENGLPLKWLFKMRANIKLVNKQFTATRMLEDYYSKLYETSLASVKVKAPA